VNEKFNFEEKAVVFESQQTQRMSAFMVLNEPIRPLGTSGNVTRLEAR